MNKKLHFIALSALIQLTIQAQFNAQRSIKKITSFFTHYTAEQIDHKEFPATTLHTLSIENINGPITIKTGWEKESLFLKTTKRAKKKSDLENITIVDDQINKKHLSIFTQYTHKKLQGLVEYELLVPSSMTIQLKTNEGDIIINDIQGHVKAIAHNGNISIINTKNNIQAQTVKTGNIFIDTAYGPVESYTNNGNVTINGACNGVVANATKGTVSVNYKTLPSLSKIKLGTIAGNISLALPATTNASIYGNTAHGTVMSEHLITLKECTTKLDNHAWNRFKKEVDGFLGSGDATISLKSTYGNIKITETKIT
jgi:hypothetical protein